MPLAPAFLGRPSADLLGTALPRPSPGVDLLGHGPSSATMEALEEAHSEYSTAGREGGSRVQEGIE
jgi:hypothetical protein